MSIPFQQYPTREMFTLIDNVEFEDNLIFLLNKHNAYRYGGRHTDIDLIEYKRRLKEAKKEL